MSTPPILVWDQAYNRNGDVKLPRSVVNVIRTYANNDTLEGWVTAETLARATGLQIRAVRKQIAANVAAGWLEIVKSGNSSGLANTYRLTYPKGVLQDTVAAGDTPSKGVPEDTVANDQRVSQRAPLHPEGCPTGPSKGVLQNTPTSPGTSPKREVPRGTTTETDPTGSATGDSPPIEIASESKGVLQDTVPDLPSGIWDMPSPFDALPAYSRSPDPDDPWSR
ncbi:hypothetical protein [Mycobacterium sp. C31M]